MRLPLALALVVTSVMPAFAADLEAVAERVRITPAQAIRIAQGSRPGRIHELELKARGQEPVYRIEFEDDRLVHVHAVTGRILVQTRKEAKP